MPPAAWYPDPARIDQLRWWDGGSWTDETTPPLAAQPAWVPWQPEREPEVTAAAGYLPMGSFGRADQPAAPYEAAPAGSTTIWVWLLALLPLGLAAILELRLSGSGYIYLGPLGLYVTFALFDRRALVTRGFEAAPNQWWILVPPVYFLLRAAKTTAASYPPFIGWLLTMVLATAVVTNSGLGLGIFPSSAPPEGTAPAGLTPPYTEEELDYLLTPEGMAEQLQAELGLSFDTFTCVPLASLEVSTATSCTGSYVGTTVDIDVQVVQREANADPFIVVSTRTSLPQ